MKSKFLLLLAIMFIFACGDNECADETRIENDNLSAEALSYNPYSASDRKAIFMDEEGREFEFLIERNNIETSVNHISGFCYEGEFLKIYLRGTELNQYFHFWINDVPKPNDDNASGEGLYILHSKTEDTGTQLNIDELCLEHSINIVDEMGERLFTEKTTIVDNMEINGRIFFNVIRNNDVNTNPDVEVFYNMEMGLIGFTEVSGGATFHLDRIEN